MGQAKRRKLTDYPAHGGRVEDFKVRDGVAAITVDVAGTAPLTYAVEAADLTDGVARFAASLDPKASYERVCRAIVGQVQKTRLGTSTAPTEIVGFGAFWIALHHPTGGLKVRQAVSTAMRTKGRAHLTLTIGQQGLVITLADQFADVQDLLKQATQQDAGVFVYEAPPPPEGEAH